MLGLRRNGQGGRLRGGPVIAAIAFAVVSLIIYWNGWPSVPYAMALKTLGRLVFGLVYKVGEGVENAVWYMVYIVFLTGMTYVGGIGKQILFNIDVGSLIVVAVSLAVFLPWAVASRLPRSEAQMLYAQHFPWPSRERISLSIPAGFWIGSQASRVGCRRSGNLEGGTGYLVAATGFRCYPSASWAMFAGPAFRLPKASRL